MQQMVSTFRAMSTGTARNEFIIDLAELDGKMLPLVGGKAGNLGELIRAGLPVPPGFCVSTAAYARVVPSASIAYASFGSAEPEEVKRLARHARDSVLSAPVPKAVAAALTDAYERLGSRAPVAVRSSATAEDLPHASFAGQQDTYLNVVGADAVLDAVRRCWASLWTDRAVVYRTTNGIDHSAVRLAVVVQRMVDAKIAGVLFTANPVTGRRGQAVIDANPGLGEAVVSGAVNPDHFVVDTDTGEIVERRLGDKRVEILSLPGGGTRHVEKSAAKDEACLRDDQISALAKLGRRVETYFGAPQDAEWAIDDQGSIWLTQARPITTLFPLPVRRDKAADLRVYFCFSVAQGLYRPITPMGLAGFRVVASGMAGLFGIKVVDPLAGPPVYAEAAQRLFIDLTTTLRGRVGSKLMPRVLDVMEARSAAILRHLMDSRLPGPQGSYLPFFRRVFNIAVGHAVPLRIMEALARPEAARARVERIGEKLQGRLEISKTANATERLDFIERALATEVVTVAPATLPVAAAGLAMLGVAGALLGDDAKPGELEKVLRGLPHNVTTQMDLALWKLAGLIGEDTATATMFRDESAAELSRRFREGRLPGLAQQAIDEFLRQYGHRGVAEIDIGMPRWSDDPTHILGILANYLLLKNPEQAPDALFARGAIEAQETIDSLVTRARRRGALRARLVRFALGRARQLAGLRETPKYYIILVIAAVRRELTIIGAELARRGSIEITDDVFFLDLAEVRAALRGGDFRSVVANRRQAYDLEMRRRHVPGVILSDGTEPEVHLTTRVEGAGLVGTPASVGTVTGMARVVLDPVGAHLEPGEILVAPSTDPGWTPLFLTAGGLIMEMGGANSHGAVVAREYGIPAVVGVPDATLRITTGQQITIDGGSGTITLMDGSS